MSLWVVTVVGEDHESGPAVVVEAEDYQSAAEEGLRALRDADEGSHPWGVTCVRCEGYAIEAVFVLPFADRVSKFVIGESLREEAL